MSAAHAFAPAARMPLDIALAVIPSLPRAVLARLVERAIERLDAIDGNSDFEPNGDSEPAGDECDGDGADDDGCFGAMPVWLRHKIGNAP